MKRTVKSIVIKDATDNTRELSGFFVPSVISVKRTTGRDKAGPYEILEMSGRVSDEYRRNKLLTEYVILSFTYDDGTQETYGTGDYPVNLTIDDFEGITTFKIKYEKPL